MTPARPKGEKREVAVINYADKITREPGELCKAAIQQIDDLRLVEIAKARANEKGEPVDIDEL